MKTHTTCLPGSSIRYAFQENVFENADAETSTAAPGHQTGLDPHPYPSIGFFERQISWDLMLDEWAPHELPLAVGCKLARRALGACMLAQEDCMSCCFHFRCYEMAHMTIRTMSRCCQEVFELATGTRHSCVPSPSWACSCGLFGVVQRMIPATQDFKNNPIHRVIGYTRMKALWSVRHAVQQWVLPLT